MLITCREYYHGNSRVLEDIDSFEKDCHPDRCIWWYTKDTFVYRLINKALRTEDTEQLYLFRYFIVDLSEQLAKEYLKIRNGDDEKIYLYRGVTMHRKEMENLKENVENLLQSTVICPVVVNATSRFVSQVFREIQQTW